MRVRIRLTEWERYTIGEFAALIGLLMLGASLLGLWALLGNSGM